MLTANRGRWCGAATVTLPRDNTDDPPSQSAGRSILRKRADILGADAGALAGQRPLLLSFRALETSLAVMSTIGIMCWYAIRVGPITPSVPTTWPSTS